VKTIEVAVLREDYTWDTQMIEVPENVAADFDKLQEELVRRTTEFPKAVMVVLYNDNPEEDAEH